MTFRLICLLVACSAAGLPVCRAQQARSDGAGSDVHVLGYDVRVEPDFGSGSIRGRTTVRFTAKGDRPPQALFDAGALTIDSARLDGRAVVYRKSGSQVVVELSALDQSMRRSTGDHELDFFYHGTPPEGLEFEPERGEVYTIFSSSQWMVCKDAPNVRAPLRLQVALPDGLSAVGSGVLADRRREPDGKVLHTWEQSRALPSFLYGFAAGKYRMVKKRLPGVELQFLSVDRSPSELEEIFADTADMVRFYSGKSGVPFKGTYAQVLVARTIGQEAGGFAMLSEAYGRSVLERQAADPATEGLIAHELAHQWWGALVTNESWSHFWLNEGFAVFMAAAYLEHRFGPSIYAEAVAHWQKKAQSLAARGKDHALVYDEWSHPTADDRTVVYQRGALVLHQLRGHLGDDAFWRGIRQYTQRHQGRSVNTRDFMQAMEHASHRDLREFFARRVYGTAPPE